MDAINTSGLERIDGKVTNLVKEDICHVFKVKQIINKATKI